MNIAEDVLVTVPFFGLPVKVTRVSLFGTLGLIIVFALLAGTLGGLSVGMALLAGLLVTLLHWLISLLHHLGHHTAAQMTGYPMQHVRLQAIWGASVYPDDEDDLPPQVHIRRAIGGPIMSFSVTLVLAVLYLVFMRQSDFVRVTLAMVTLDNLLVFTLGAVFPPVHIGDFRNDGATILYWRKREQDNT